jgi:hypothetical protein
MVSSALKLMDKSITKEDIQIKDMDFNVLFIDDAMQSEA